MDVRVGECTSVTFPPMVMLLEGMHLFKLGRGVGKDPGGGCQI